MSKKIISIFMVLLISLSGFLSTAYADSYNTPGSVNTGPYGTPGNKNTVSKIDKRKVISIVPLDSRPCNTQYPQLIGGIMNQNVILPPAEILDNYTSPSNSEALWKWMDDTAKYSDKMIIYTNQLFNGGLIASRSYVNSDSIEYDVNRLSSFIAKYPNVDIVVVSILPRLLPSQFDVNFQGYQKALAEWGKKLDFNYTMNVNPPTYPENVPLDVAKRYQNLYNYHANLSTKLGELANSGVLKNYFIGQDDGEEFAPSNIIYRKLLEKAYKNVTIQKGADELTMMICAMDNPKPREINLVYTNPDAISTYLPYESAPLKNIVNEKLQILGIKVNPNSKDTLIIHNDPNYSFQVTNLLPNDKKGYVAIADVAYTNRGDVNLKSLLFNKDNLYKVDAYSGWNTGANTIGTALSQYIATKYLEENYDKMDDMVKSHAIDALYQFKYVRLAEDIIYQGQMVRNMREIFTSRGMRMVNGDIYSTKKHEAEALLNEYAFKYIIELNKLFIGPNKLLLGDKIIETNYSFVNSQLLYPWHRTFEIKVNPIFTK
ncbi:MAG: DUF4127 family protein [Proteocatella sp.]